MVIESENSCPHCFESVDPDHDFCNNCGGHLKKQLLGQKIETLDISKEEKKDFTRSVMVDEITKQGVTQGKFKQNIPTNLSIIFTVIAALLYAIPMPAISLYGGVPFSVLAIITAIIGMFNPYLKTRKIWAIIIAFLAPVVWITQFMFLGIYWL